ncbi:NADP-dependent oxidoreductase [Agromyces atrinae]|uniref:NADP-dependent oxidoreductase n=1 Tax=Agromyces atrinae TaxID=592376 RepID=UPI001F59C34A|nr:NADP-dependent oxidoreductase [Agromyces atrinae]MCI2956681.1 NADP-dependent oxidoreductase [Agromyces atrinae]
MKVFALHDFGQAPEITDIARPEPEAGELRVRVRAASVNGFDLAVANGYLQGAMEHNFPVVLGKDFAGEIDAIGADVAGFAVGDRVFGVVTKATLGDGSIGEYVTVPAAIGVALLPDGIDFTEAAGLGLAGTAAVDSVDAAQIGEGSTVLIAGATGGVGQQALQLAVRAGASVIATASTPDEIELVTRLGAARTVDYTGDVTAQVAALYAEGVDVVLHFAGAPDALVPAVAPGGRFVSTLLQSAADVEADGVEVVSIYATPSAETLARVARHEHEKHTVVTVQRVYELDQASDAFGDFAAGTLGKLIIAIN